MTAHVHLEIAASALRWPALPVCRATLVNTGDAALQSINAWDPRGRAVLELTCVATGEQTVIPAPILDPSAVLLSEPRSLAPTARHVDEFSLRHRLTLPRPGQYLLRACFAWADGEARSDAVPFAVEAAPAGALSLELECGGPRSALVCVWTDRDAASVRATEIGEFPAPGFSSTVDLARADASAAPVLSVAADRLPARRFTAWICEHELGYAVRGDAIFDDRIDLQEPGWRIVGPLCELPTDAPAAADAELLLLRDEGERWRLRAIRLVDTAVLGDDFVGPAPAPCWTRVAVRPDGARRLFGATTTDEGTSLWRMPWAAGDGPAAPQQLLALPGELLAAAAQLGAEGMIFGAAVVVTTTPHGPLHTLWSWSLTTDDQLHHRSAALTCLTGAAVDEAIVAVDLVGDAAVLVRRGDEWSHIDALRPEVAAPAPELASPLQLAFLRGRTPVVVHAAPGHGLRLHLLGAPPRFIAPT